MNFAVASVNFLQSYRRAEAELQRLQSELLPDPDGLPVEVSRLLIGIHDNLFSSELNVKTLKAQCEVVDNNASSRFRHFVGRTIKEYIDFMRMQAAARLLRHSSLGVFDVAVLLGYEHPQTFYRVFRRRFQCTPADFRRLAAGTPAKAPLPRAADRVVVVRPYGATHG